MEPNSICYAEIPAPDMDKATRFYGSVFGWSIEESNLSGQRYCMFSTGENDLMGGFDSTGTIAKGGVLLYLKVSDIPAALKKIKSAGGSVIKEKTEIGGNYGFFAIFNDPNGNQVGIWSKS